ncbi:ImmA/IrrE family metallo-endopeptidase [Burkholderia gladioli]|uniref:ImmA/IrrE family metallo-endopeptidase n=1 Tax=Burkholderia gladioli TaxID=28095 RepID=UPI001640BDF3|nr:ImmA/IrrE family metallo-endopeptidase [Burkholderia gladioli]
MSEFKSFGSPDRFEIAARWSADPERRERLPLEEGWSTADLRITVGNQVLTEHRYDGQSIEYISWYLSPVIDWLIASWTWLFHEEGYAWADKTGAPTAVATLSALDRTIASPNPSDRDLYRLTQAWWRRHALRAADSSALYPEIYFRRLADDIEISWLDRQPPYAPDGFVLTLSPGYALLPVRAVAEPLWQFLDWAINSAVVANDHDSEIVTSLKSRFESLRRTPFETLELRHVGERVQALIEKARREVGFAREQNAANDIPVIESLDSAVLMFGGINVDIEEPDVKRLIEFLAKQHGGAESDAVKSLTMNPGTDPWIQPYEEGYRLAEEVRDELGIQPEELCIDIIQILERLNIRVEDVKLDTDAIRGVAVAGDGFAPAILVNTHSPYNVNKAGRRFTLTHELCHILFDRTRAKKLSHLSGPWASTRTEKRANAFAAMFLASTAAISRSLTSATSAEIRQLAKNVGFGFSAMVEHLYNIDLIGDAERERLRN